MITTSPKKMQRPHLAEVYDCECEGEVGGQAADMDSCDEEKMDDGERCTIECYFDGSKGWQRKRGSRQLRLSIFGLTVHMPSAAFPDEKAPA